MMQKNNIDQIYAQTSELIEQEQFGKAYKICSDILLFDPNNVKFLRLKNEIESKVKLKNSRIIYQELAKIRPLLDNGLYEEYLSSIAPLHHYASDFPIISKLILQATKKLQKKQEESQNKFISEKITEVLTEIKNNKADLALSIVEALLKAYPQDKKIRNIYRQAVSLKIKHEIEINKPLLESNKFENINIFLLELQKLDKSNKTIKKLLERNKNNFHEFRLEEKKDFIFKTMEEIKTLLILKKYESAQELIEKILEIDPENSIYLNLYSKIKNKILRTTSKQINLDTFKYFMSHSSDHRNNPQNYISI